MGRLTQKELENMKNHQYHSAGYSWLDNKLNPYWNFCASLLPYSFSPNMVTLTGFLCQSSSLLLISFFDLTLSKPLPSFCYVLFFILLFAGQTFDAIDGKHARNTKRSSSLGQLMDHGCDSMSNYVVSTIICQAHCFGNSIYTLLLQFGIQSGFYILTLEEHFSGVLGTNVDNIGVTEYQLLAMLTVLLPAFVGQLLSETKIFGLSITSIALIGVLASSFFTCIKIIVKDSKNLKDAWQKWNQIYIFAILSAAQFLLMKSYLYEKYPFFVVMLNGNYFGFLATKLIMSTMSKRELKFYDLDVFVFATLVVINFILRIEWIEILIVVFLAIWFVIRYYLIVIGSIKDLLNYLKISF